MIDLERTLLLCGWRRNSDWASLSELDDEWIVTDEAVKSFLCMFIHICIDAARDAEKRANNYRTMDDSPAIKSLFDLKINGIKWTTKEQQ